MRSKKRHAQQYVDAIQQSGLSIYDPIHIGDPTLWIPNDVLEQILTPALTRLSLQGLPLRTRSKRVKQHVCQALGYPVPTTFKRTRPRFPGQCFDIYTQKSDNLQIWNEAIAPTRRYVLIRVSEGGDITRVKVVTGETLARFDTTGTLTRKYQAQLITGTTDAELVTPIDTDTLRPLLGNHVALSPDESPDNPPRTGQLMPIREIFIHLRPLIGTRFADSGYDQERNRGTALHRLVCTHLGYANYHDDGQFPDVRHQLLEVKLQTSPTIDLGLIRPDSTEPLLLPGCSQNHIRHCDVRYLLFYAVTNGRNVSLTQMYLTTGERFFTRFRQFAGNIQNSKLQIPLPAHFFGR